ncbi:MAG: PAS domain-containing protein [bacterium]
MKKRRETGAETDARPAGGPHAEPDVQRLIHELRIHQIELEAQNEELQAARGEADAGRARFVDLYDLAPIGYVTLDGKGVIREANLTMAMLLGVARSQLVGKWLRRFIRPEDQDAFRDCLRRFRERRETQAGSAPASTPQECEMRMVCAGGATRWMLLHSAMDHEPGQSSVCRIMVSDIQERKLIEGVQAFLSQQHNQFADGQFFNGLARYLAQILEMDYICIDRLLGDAMTAETLAVFHQGRFENNNTYALQDTPCGEVVKQTTCCFPRDVRRLFPRDAALLALQAESYVGTVLWSYEGKPIGLIAAIGRKPLATPRLAETLLKLVAIRAASELERLQVEALQAAAHRKTLALLESIGDGFFSLDREWTVTYVNEGGARLLGKARAEMLGRNLWACFPQAEAVAPFRQAYERALATQESASVESFFLPLNAWFEARAFPSPEGLSVFYQNITERKLAEAYREMRRDVLQILNESGVLKKSMPRILAALKSRSGLDAVGIRLQAGDDFPYFVQQGFAGDFLLSENTLVVHVESGGGCRSHAGQAGLACTCGLVLDGKTDPASPFFTPGGSFWTNDSAPLLDLPAEKDFRLQPRNRCVHQGYASFALVPIRNMERIVGLLQFNDRRKGCFTAGTMEILENIASHIGAALMRQETEASLREATAVATASRTAVDVLEAMGEGVLLLNMAGTIMSVNPALTRLTGLPPDRIVGQPIATVFSRLVAPEDRKAALAFLCDALQQGTGGTAYFSVVVRGGGCLPFAASPSFAAPTASRRRWW